jgi:competence protein ComGC
MNEIPPSVPQVKTSGLATSSLVLGILAIVLCFVGPLFAIPAVICGHVAHSRIKNSGGLLGGKGLATGGLITGYLSFAMIPVVGLLAAIAIPNFVKARQTAQANSCINHMRQIESAVQQWALDNHKKETDAIDPTAVGAYLKSGIPECPAGGHYTFGASVGTYPVVTCSVPGHSVQ